MSAKLKLLGVSSAPSAMPTAARQAATAMFPGRPGRRLQEDRGERRQQPMLGAVLVGDVEDYGNLLQMMLNALPLPATPTA